MKPRHTDLTEGPIASMLIKLTWPMVLGILGMVMFNLADTYFIGQVGVDELAAMGFTFPVVMVVGALALGIGIGTSSLMSRSIVSEDKPTLRKYASEALLLGMLFVSVLVVIGQFTIDPLFRAMGASDEILPHIRDYMSIWYWGMLLFIIAQLWSEPIAGVFSDNAEVTRITAEYLIIVSFSYGFQGILMVGVNVFNGINKPLPSAGLTALRMFGLYVPLAWLASVYWDLTGVFWSAFLANILTGILTYTWLCRYLRKRSGAGVPTSNFI